MILIGTSGYSYQDWVGPVYPAGSKKNEFLTLYAANMDMVELNFSYYTQPRPQTLGKMVRDTREGFLFSIKAHKSLTHEVTSRFEDDAQRFAEGIEPLIESHRLACILLQFPYSFHYTTDNRRYLDSLTKLWEILPLAIEFRNDEWQRPSVYRTLKDRNIGIVCVDLPSLPHLPRAEGTVTSSEIGYIRFHGRNKENWWQGDNTSRYDYEYSDDELEQWIDRIAGMVRKVRILLVAFNNHFRGQAYRNAGSLKGLLSSME